MTSIESAGNSQPHLTACPSILCVEDDVDMGEMMQSFLEAEGYEVTLAATKRAALDQIATNHFDVIVTDHLLPDGTGAELLQEAVRRGILNGTRAVMVTANANPERIVRPRGVRAFAKPVDIERFLTAVRELATQPPSGV